MAQANKTTNDDVVTGNQADLEKYLLNMRDSFRHHQNEIRKKYKISANEMEIILYISEFGPQRMKTIGEKFKIKFSTLTSLVDKIERLNLVKRVNSKEDRRSILVTLTKKGNRMLDEYNEQVKNLAEKISSLGGSKEAPSFLDTLEKVSPMMVLPDAAN
ncbi:MAG: MarR family winged helix-turn-helix transcriptional regulator [Bacteroidota bacterium]